METKLHSLLVCLLCLITFNLYSQPSFFQSLLNAEKEIPAYKISNLPKEKQGDVVDFSDVTLSSIGKLLVRGYLDSKKNAHIDYTDGKKVVYGVLRDSSFFITKEDRRSIQTRYTDSLFILDTTFSTKQRTDTVNRLTFFHTRKTKDKIITTVEHSGIKQVHFEGKIYSLQEVKTTTFYPNNKVSVIQYYYADILIPMIEITTTYKKDTTIIAAIYYDLKAIAGYAMDKIISAPKEESSGFEKLTIHPNPATDFVNFAFAKTASAKIKITNIYGVVVFEDKIFNNATIDIKTFPSGTYIVTAEVDNEVIQSKFIKQ